MNFICIDGYLIEDAKIIKSNENNQKNRATFAVAVRRDGNQNNENDLFQVVCWGQKADMVEEEMRNGRFLKGCHASVTGKMQSSAYTDRNTGKKLTNWQITARDCSSIPRSMNQQYQGQGSYRQDQYQGQGSYQQGQYQGQGSYRQDQYQGQGSYRQDQYQGQGSYQQGQYQGQGSYQQGQSQGQGSYQQGQQSKNTEPYQQPQPPYQAQEQQGGFVQGTYNRR